MNILNPIALRKAKNADSFAISECNRVKLFCIYFRKVDCVELLTKSGGNINQEDNAGRSVWHIFCYHNNPIC